MYLYVLYNSKIDKYYIGVTDNYERRIQEHRKNSFHGFTSRGNNEWKLVGYKEFADKNEAYKEEMRLKKAKNKKYIEWYIKNKLFQQLGP